MKKKRKRRAKFKRKGAFFVYILECKDRTFYTGYTLDLKRRLKLHNSGRGAKYTRDRQPVKPVWCKKFKYFKLAFREEKRIKRLTREQKERLIKEAPNFRAKMYLFSLGQNTAYKLRER
ncbi:MAG: GIY-YIG nuclease family protein [Candidatus Omnitrophota bacterium]